MLLVCQTLVAQEFLLFVSAGIFLITIGEVIKVKDVI